MTAGTGPQRGFIGHLRDDDYDNSGLLFPRSSQLIRDQIDLLFLVLIFLVLL